VLIIRRSPNIWFKVWSDLIKKEKEINRVDLANLSNCSLWTLRALSKDFCDQDYYIEYKNGKYVYWDNQIEHSPISPTRGMK